MLTNNSKTNWTAIALLTAIVALIGSQSFARRHSAGPAQPAIIATFDLEKTFNALDEKTRADEALRKMAEEMNVQGEAKSKALKQFEADLQDHVPGSDKHRDLLDKAALASQEYRAYIDFCKAKIELERTNTLKRLYQQIKHAAGEMARENNYAVVFVDDSIAEIPPGNEEEINRQISARRMVYTDPRVDITDELISRLNTASKAASAAKSR